MTHATYFVPEDGIWKHRFAQEEIDLFMAGVSFEESVAAPLSSSLWMSLMTLTVP